MHQLEIALTFCHHQHKRYNSKRIGLLLVAKLFASSKASRVKRRVNNAVNQLKIEFWNVVQFSDKKLVKPLVKKLGSGVVEQIRRGVCQFIDFIPNKKSLSGFYEQNNFPSYAYQATIKQLIAKRTKH